MWCQSLTHCCQVSIDRLSNKVSEFRLMTYILCQVAHLHVKFLLARETYMKEGEKLYHCASQTTGGNYERGLKCFCIV